MAEGRRVASYLLWLEQWPAKFILLAHNLKVVGSNPTPATNKLNNIKALQGSLLPVGLFAFDL